jgi:hypothetical protein
MTEPLQETTICEDQYLIDLVLKPNENGIRSRPEEIQLLLAYIGEILREVGEDKV